MTFVIRHWWRLLDQDKAAFDQMRTLLIRKSDPSPRNTGPGTFEDALSMVKHFCLRGDAEDTVRQIVCGVVWLDGGIAINNGNLGYILGRCKSSINASLQKLAYSEIMARKDAFDLLAGEVPFMAKDRGALRKWTIRLRAKEESTKMNITPVEIDYDLDIGQSENDFDSLAPAYYGEDMFFFE